MVKRLAIEPGVLGSNLVEDWDFEFFGFYRAPMSPPKSNGHLALL